MAKIKKKNIKIIIVLTKSLKAPNNVIKITFKFLILEIDLRGLNIRKLLKLLRFKPSPPINHGIVEETTIIKSKMFQPSRK